MIFCSFMRFFLFKFYCFSLEIGGYDTLVLESSLNFNETEVIETGFGLLVDYFFLTIVDNDREILIFLDGCQCNKFYTVNHMVPLA
ncbi:hypothetical protein RCL_jg9015.t1 [Rhizophagus clarus]|uniref:Secreted protein n=1 Tax=Rhizophagus clarus TaxID=94130 RepID=A0A8H3KWX8_9GLOM|nr:hypothetical protein RCL_jg9015.t1 [Rhizophagus clarus]